MTPSARAWRHTQFLGHASMMMTQASNILSSDTPTETAKQLAREIHERAMQMREALRIRVDFPAPGT